MSLTLGKVVGQPSHPGSYETMFRSSGTSSEVSNCIRVSSVNQHAAVNDLLGGAANSSFASASRNHPALDGGIQLADLFCTQPRNSYSCSQTVAFNCQSEECLVVN